MWNSIHKSRERARFALSLLTEASAPTNTLLGNPSALAKAVQTRGQSLVTGLRHAGHDLRHNGGMPAQVDTRPFRVGGNLAVTPGQVVHRNDVFELIQYAATTDQTFQLPLVAIPPQINKYYITDLAPGRSIVEYAVAAGIPYFAISWRNPTAAQRDWNLDTYVAACKEAVEVSCDIAGTPHANTLGYLRRWHHDGVPARSPGRHRRATGALGHIHGCRLGHRGRIDGRPVRIQSNHRGGSHQVAEGGGPRGRGLGQGVRMDATQRPGVELLGQQLPARAEPARLRHPVLERRHHPASRRSAL